MQFVVYDTRNKTIKWEKGPNRILDMADAPEVLDMEWSSLYVPSQVRAPRPARAYGCSDRPNRAAWGGVCVAGGAMHGIGVARML